jgi:CRISPR-associated DxTHG motif protein
MSEKKAVITILGTIGGWCDREDSKKGCYRPETEKALYRSEIDEIKESKNINTLPILINSFQDYQVVSLYTSCAKDIQEKVLEEENISYEFNSLWQIEDDLEFDDVFKKIDAIINHYDKVIIDVSHGFRHLPILMIVNTIMHNIDSIDKVEKILFAKEIEKFKEYRFIDLKRYLDLANISYALTTFDRNYTVANNVKVTDNHFSELLDDLSDFSKHILANSIDELLKDTNKQKAITTKLIVKLNQLLENDDTMFMSLNRLLVKILKHIESIDNVKNEQNYKQLYYISKNMLNKGYLLNSITLLSEAIGMYCKEELSKLDDNLKDKIELFETKAVAEKNNEKVYFKLYELYNQSKAIYHVKNYHGNFLTINEKQRFSNPNTKQKIENWNNDVKDFTNLIKIKLEKDEDIVELVKEIDSIRNNLAHANSSKRLNDVESDITKVLNSFKKICI